MFLNDVTASDQSRFLTVLILCAAATVFYVSYGPEPIIPHESSFDAHHGEDGYASPGGDDNNDGVRRNSTGGASSSSAGPRGGGTRKKFISFWRSLRAFLVNCCVCVLIMAFSDPKYGALHLITKNLVEYKVTTTKTGITTKDKDALADSPAPSSSL